VRRSGERPSHATAVAGRPPSLALTAPPDPEMFECVLERSPACPIHRTQKRGGGAASNSRDCCVAQFEVWKDVKIRSQACPTSSAAAGTNRHLNTYSVVPSKSQVPRSRAARPATVSEASKRSPGSPA